MFEVVKMLNEWIPVFLPIFAIGLGIAIVVTLVEKVGTSILGAFKDVHPNKSWLEHEQDLEAEKLKRDEAYAANLYHRLIDSLEDEPEKPKRHTPYMIVGDDGELMEVIDDKPKRGVNYD